MQDHRIDSVAATHDNGVAELKRLASMIDRLRPTAPLRGLASLQGLASKGSRASQESSIGNSADEAARRQSTAPTNWVDPHVMDQIGHLELLSRNVVDGLLAGKHRSTTKGGCSEFSQHRQYATGDEVRQIDWQVYARNDRYFIKQFEEETNLHAMLAIDTSGSMQFGLSTDSKLNFAKRAAACLARLLLHQRDAVGAVALNDQNPLYVPPKQHAAHLRAVLTMLDAAQAADAGDLGELIQQCVPRMKRRGLFILFSDCFGELDDILAGLRSVRARGHDVIVMHVLAPEELSFDFRRWSSFESLESPSHRVSLDPPTIRAEYLGRVAEFVTDLERRVVEIGGEYARMTTADDLSDVLAWFLRNRQARAGGRSR
ncbi:hypothetical protein K227x_29930 [Rubripirellula lacrimiformis]|uniref:DUF58 domain-containing protein n=1 Tax=Rubripirellula lacrimiformis TaxID=1930273 RepID=A0A517NBU0_9BACT|nr:DUF58 domain-containing protein [Rubripirellula lacrimiformis]QDT04600.1 hypothetical protein K227x_29930 [Rubripirellula lacrimiformis]